MSENPEVDCKLENDFVVVLELLQCSCLPKQKLDFAHSEEDSLKGLALQSQANLTKILNIFNTIDVTIKIPANIIVSTVFLCGEHMDQCNVWTNSLCNLYANKIVQEILRRCKCANLMDLILLYKVETFMIAMKSKIQVSSWRQFPAAIQSFKWILLNIKCPHLGDIIDHFLPVCLWLIDDYNYQNKITGLQCLQHITNNVSQSELEWFGRSAVIQKALEHMIYLREPEIIPPLASCLISLLYKSEQKGTETQLLWSQFDNILNIWLPSMEMEHRLAVQMAYIGSLNEIIDAMGLRSIRWSKKLLEIFSEYCNNDSTCEGTLKCLYTFINATWPRITSNLHTIASILVKVAIKENHKDLQSMPVKQSLKKCHQLLQKLCLVEYTELMMEIKASDINICNYYEDCIK